ncbi:SH3 domain-containing protein [Streptomyces sp. MS19]|uniref:SH3 domain-containing protein n=1 Tax=Streptomyces sp. MS19 TaxID=3385972 RepID=UPI0039A148D9
MKSSRTKLAAAVLPLAFAATSLVAAPTATATESATCTHPAWSNKDSDTGRLKSSELLAPIHTGPNAGCRITADILHGDVVYYHCFVNNSSGNSWTHVRVRIDVYDFNGWVWDEYLADNGATHRC